MNKRVKFPKATPTRPIGSSRCPKCVRGECHRCTGANCGCKLCGGTKARSVD